MNSTLSLDSPSSSRLSIPTTLKRRFSANKMLSKAKDTTKSLVQDVLEKRHSLDSKRSEEIPNTTSLISNKDSFLSNSSSNSLHDKKQQQQRYSTLSSKHNTLKSNNSQDSISSMTTDASSISSSVDADIQSNDHTAVAAAAAAAEADILSGLERPGSFALACDFHLANERHNEEFHALFKSVPDNDMLIECKTVNNFAYIIAC